MKINHVLREIKSKFLFFSICSVFVLLNQTASAQCTPNIVSDNNLIAYYKLKGGAGTDSGPNGFNLTFGASPASGVDACGNAGQSLSCTGTATSSASVAHNALMNVTNELTISCWFRAANIAAAQRLVDKAPVGNGANFLLDLNASKVRFIVAGGAHSIPTTLASNTWYHVVAVYNGTEVKIYINGALVYTGAQSGNCTSNTESLRIGKDANNGTLLAGNIDEIRVYGRAVTALEALYLYEMPLLVNSAQDVGVCFSAGTAQLTATFCGATALTYQWYKDGIALVNGTDYSNVNTASLLFLNPNSSHLGAYHIIAFSSSCVPTTSDTADVTEQLPTYESPSGNLIAYYPFTNGAGTDNGPNGFHLSMNGSSAAYEHCVNAAQAVAFTGVNAGAAVAHNAIMNVTNQLTISCWFNSNAISLNQRLVDKAPIGNGSNFLLDLNASRVRFIVAGGVHTTPTALASSTWYHVVAIYDGAEVKIYLNGALVYTGAQTGNCTSNTEALRVGKDGNNGSIFGGTIDEVRVYGRALGVNEVQNLYEKPILVSSPQDAGICLNTPSLQLYSSFCGGNLSYQWHKDGVPLTNGANYSGVTTGTLTLINPTMAEVGTYYLLAVTPSCMITSSDSANITYQTANVVSNNDLSLYYPLNGASMNDLSGNGLTLSQNGAYTAGNGYDNTPGQALNLTTSTYSPHIGDNPVLQITNQLTISMWIKPTVVANARLLDKTPAGSGNNYMLDVYQSKVRFTCAGGVLLSANTISPTYWYHIVAVYNGSTMKLFINGQLSSSVSHTGTCVSNALPLIIGRDQLGILGSNAFSGTIDEVRFYKRAVTDVEAGSLYELAPINMQPSNFMECIGNAANLSVTSPLSTATYQWHKDGMPVAGQTSSTLTIAALGSNDFGDYQCQIINGCFSWMSDTAAIGNSIDASVMLNGLTISANATGLSYQWIDCNNGNVAIVGETSQSYTPTVTGDYAVVVIDGGCSDTSICTNVVVTGLNSVIANNNNKIYPNPATNYINLELTALNKNTSAEIYDAIGKKVRSVSISNLQTQINIADLSNGIYMIKVTNGEDIQTTKFIKG